jgi:hypothetical protein
VTLGVAEGLVDGETLGVGEALVTSGVRVGRTGLRGGTPRMLKVAGTWLGDGLGEATAGGVGTGGEAVVASPGEVIPTTG